MTDAVQAALISEIGEMIVEDPAFTGHPWQALALVATYRGGSRDMVGYRYLADGSFEAEVPDNFGPLMKKLGALREVMKETSASEALWHQCLIQIMRPDYDLKIAFEYENPARWSPNGPSRDMSAFADTLRPPS